MPKKTVSLTTHAIGNISRQAKKEQRSFSNMLEVVIREYFAEEKVSITLRDTVTIQTPDETGE